MRVFFICVLVTCFFSNLFAQSADKIVLQTNKTSYVPGDTIIFTAIIPQLKDDNIIEKKLKLEVLNELDTVIMYQYFRIVNGISKGALLIDTAIEEPIYAINIKVVTEQDVDLAFNNATLTLKTVLVKNTIKRTTKQINEEYATGMFKNMSVARTLDLINEPPNNTGIGIPILQYIQGKMAGLMVTVGAGGRVSLTSMRRNSITSASPILIYLDEQEAGDFINLVYPRDVALVKYWPPGTAQIPGSGGAGVLAIYTKKFNDLR
ncbi:MAG: hypothetical protein RLZ95_1482 [Bacteroidota bacterium]